YIAHAARENKISIPEFMLPVSDLGEIDKRILRWRRSQEIERWNQKLGSLNLAQKPKSALQNETDLRLVIAEADPRLQVRRPGHEEFDYLRFTPHQQLAREYDAGNIQFTTEAEVLWHSFSARSHYGAGPLLRYTDPEALRILGKLLRSRLLDSRIVTL